MLVARGDPGTRLAKACYVILNCHKFFNLCAWSVRTRCRGYGGGLSAAYLVIAGLGVPAMTFTGLWLWRLRSGRGHVAEPGSLSAEAQLAGLAAGIYPR